MSEATTRETKSTKDEAAHEPIWEKIQKRLQSIPAEELSKLPTDGAAEHDHYLYGKPKRNDKRKAA